MELTKYVTQNDATVLLIRGQHSSTFTVLSRGQEVYLAHDVDALAQRSLPWWHWRSWWN